MMKLNHTRNLMPDKPIYWIGTSKQDLAKFPQDAKRKAGFQLRAVHRGDSPIDFKPMSIVGKAVEEIRINTGQADRVFYVARFAEAVMYFMLLKQRGCSCIVVAHRANTIAGCDRVIKLDSSN